MNGFSDGFDDSFISLMRNNIIKFRSCHAAVNARSSISIILRTANLKTVSPSISINSSLPKLGTYKTFGSIAESTGRFSLRQLSRRSSQQKGMQSPHLQRADMFGSSRLTMGESVSAVMTITFLVVHY